MFVCMCECFFDLHFVSLYESVSLIENTHELQMRLILCYSYLFFTVPEMCKPPCVRQGTLSDVCPNISPSDSGDVFYHRFAQEISMVQIHHGRRIVGQMAINSSQTRGVVRSEQSNHKWPISIRGATRTRDEGKPIPKNCGSELYRHPQ